MTRDAEVPARTFVDLVLGDIAHETDSSVVQVLLRQLTTTMVDLYLDPARRPAAARRTADRLLALAREAEPGSDTQLQLVKAFAARAVDEAHLTALAGLLDGSAPLPGLSVDTDLRWELLTGLVAGGRAGEAEIAAQLATDATATGERAAAAARAAVPTAEAKAAAFDAAVRDASLANALQTATIAGLTRVPDPDARRDLLEPLVEPYFDALLDVWATRTNETAQNVVSGLFPTLLTGTGVDVLGRTDAWLEANPDAPAALRRLVAESRDGVRRALAAQAVDAAG